MGVRGTADLEGGHIASNVVGDWESVGLLERQDFRSTRGALLALAFYTSNHEYFLLPAALIVIACR